MMGTLEDTSRLLQHGLDLHRAGQLDEAMRTYETLLARAPAHGDALHLMGEALHRLGRARLGLNYLNRAVALSPHHFYLNTRGTILLQLGHLAESQQDLRRAIKASPDYAEAYVNLSAVYRQQKKYKHARDAAREATRLAPAAPAAWNNAGAIDLELGRFDEAVRQFEEALRLDPRYAPAHKNIARIQLHAGDWAAALPSLQSASVDPVDLETPWLLARALLACRRPQEAVLPMQRAMRGWSADARAGALRDPEGMAALFAVCAALEGAQSRHEESAELYQLGLGALPHSELLLNNLGATRFRLGRYQAAIEALEGALAQNPKQVLARCNLGVALLMSGDSKSAIAQFERCLRDDPMFMPAMVWLLGEKAHVADWAGIASLRDRIAQRLDDPGTPAASRQVSSFILMSNYDDPQSLMRWSQAAAAPAAQGWGIERFAPPPSIGGRAGGRLRIGYYSYDFRNHPVAHLTAELFERHDREAFEVFVYSYGPDDGHPVRQRIEAAAEHFVDLHGASIEQMAQRIRDDEVDVLIDLSGDTRGAKPQLMAYHAAPAQAAWLGYMGTSGGTHYDYLISDNFLTPPGSESGYTEKLMCLPDTFQVIDTRRQAAAMAARRADHGLPEHAFVFCNFSQSFKIQPETFESWVQIMRHVPHAVLWLAQGPSGFEDNLRAQWNAAGLAADRLVIAPRVPIDQHLARIGLADLFLDTYPYGSGATANDALWSGLPMLALVGNTMVSRMAGSLLQAVGLPELIARGRAQYVEKAVHFAHHPGQLGGLRARLETARLARSGYFDTPRFVCHLEDGLRRIAERARAGLPAQHVRIQPL